MNESIINNELFDKFLELSDVSSVFRVLSRIEYIILRKLIKKADNTPDNSGRIFLEEIKNDMNLPMPKVSEMVQTMNDDGLLAWKLDSVTKKTYVEVTEKGREKCELQHQGMKKISERIDNELTDKEKDAIFCGLRKLGHIIDEERVETEAYFDILSGKYTDNMNIISLIKPKKNVVYLNCEYTVKKAMDVLEESRYSTLPVIDNDGLYLGTISDGDVLKYINKYGLDNVEADYLLNIVNTKRNPPVHDFDNSTTIISSIMEQNFLCMVDDRGCFIGIITRKDVIGYMKKRIEKSVNRD